ncbi:DUF4265 domain-containing protein [Pedobacter duraquae]|uniref:Uncharacterized protein DUF4265 n=1 Tax=Pedobacter duraquae TaxID=425511 RepID=A0A4R6INS5_9SPHI|nr:DUF4265 domain-containing protein [Pedobacter duraquae]TDO23771.1 uncharacterized protein DUF4265 [Pedobacter duraquae]
MAEEEYEKILFKFYSNVLDEETIETMWAVIVDKEKGLYKLDSIPFYAPDVAANDIIYAEFDEYQERLTYRHTVEASGNSTVQVVILESGNDTNEIREVFDLLGCSSEKYSERYFVIDVPGSLNYAVVQDKLTELQNAGILDYAEPCLSKKHGLE